MPTNLQNFSSSASIVTPEHLTERQPRNVNEALTRVPGVIVINDDGNAMHGGIGLRGSPPRRTRKVLYMEDGHPLNLGALARSIRALRDARLIASKASRCSRARSLRTGRTTTSA